MHHEQEKKDLIESIKFSGYLKSKKLEKALEEVPRHLFVPENLRDIAYRDMPLSIGFDQTISQPSTVVIMTEALDVKEGQKILEVGTGSGWQAGLIGKMVGKKGTVYTIERIEVLADFAKDNLEKVKLKNVKVFVGDGSSGLKEFAPYDRIIVTAASPDIPKTYLEQLKDKGKIVIPIGSQYIQTMFVIEKKGKEIIRRELGNFVFVPLIGKEGFK